MAARSKKTEVHQANNLSTAPAKRGQKPSVGVFGVKSSIQKMVYSVTIEGKVYAITARDAKEAAYKARLIHYNKKER